MAERGKTTPGDIAAYLELGHGTVYGAFRGRPIGDAFVSALMKKLRGPDKVRLAEFLIPADADEQVAA